MDYQEFKDFILVHLWKQGDQVVLDALDKLTLMAEAELNRTIKIEARTTVADIVAESTSVDLPDDYRSMRNVSSPKCSMVYLTPQQFSDAKAAGNFTRSDISYTIAGNKLRLLGDVSVEKPLSLELWYYRNIPNFKETDSSWLVDEYLDLYTYSVLKHSAPFLREDERLSTWGSLYNSPLASVVEEDNERKYAGSPLRISLPAGVR